MPTPQEILDKLTQTETNLDDMSTLADQLIGAIVAGDALAVQLRADIASLLAGNAPLAAKADQLFAKSVATEDKMRAGVPGVPPVGGPPLLTSYDTRAEFDAAVAAYTGPEAVNLDGIEVKQGTAPAIERFTHSDGTPPGVINSVGPTS